MKIIKSSVAKTLNKTPPKPAGKKLAIVKSPTEVQAKQKKSLHQVRINPKLPINQIIVDYIPDIVSLASSESKASGNESKASDNMSTKIVILF
jgi:hypothetical protein